MKLVAKWWGLFQKLGFQNLSSHLTPMDTAIELAPKRCLSVHPLEGTASIATLTLPSHPVISYFTLASLQKVRGFSSCRRTTSPVLMVVSSQLLPAFRCRCDSLKFSRYSNCHRFQKWLRTVLRYFILLVRWSRASSISSSSGSSQQIPSGKLRILFPVKK